MTKLKAFSIHLGISFAIFLFILYFILFHWYPQPFFTTDGGWQGIRIVAGVDLILGPLLTLVVFKPGKPSLKFDMSVIALIQTVALISGTWVVFNESPVAVIFADDKFRPIPGYQFKEAGADMSTLYDFGETRPVLVYTELPTEHDKLQQVRRKAFGSKRPLYLHGELYKPFNKEFVQQLCAQNIDMEFHLEVKTEKDKNIYHDFINAHPEALSKFMFLPLHSRYSNFIVVFDPQTIKFIDALDISPPTDISGKTITLRQPKKLNPGKESISPDVCRK